MKYIAKHALIAVVISFIASAFFLVSQNPSARQTVALATTVKPETFTELYFENHQTLSKQTEIQKAQTFSFTIHNVEYNKMTYPYEVYIEDTEGNRAEILKDIVVLNHDEKKTIPVYYELLQPLTRAKVVVNLPTKNQEIHYWIGDLNNKGATVSSQEASLRN